MPYEHPEDNNLKNLHKSMEYNSSGEPVVRTTSISSALTTAIGIADANGNSGGLSYIEKHGINVDIGTNKETIWDVGGVYEYLLAAETVAVASVGQDNPAGTGARVIKICGLDANYNEIEEILPIDGTVSTSAFLRIFEANIIEAGSNNVNENVLDVVSTSTMATLAQISVDGTGSNAAGRGQTFMTMYTVPAGKTAYLTQWTVGAGKQNTDAIAMLYTRPFGSNPAFSAKDVITVSATSFAKDYQVPLVFAEKTDIEVRAYSTTNNSLVSSTFNLLLVTTV